MNFFKSCQIVVTKSHTLHILARKYPKESLPKNLTFLTFGFGSKDAFFPVLDHYLGTLYFKDYTPF